SQLMDVAGGSDHMRDMLINKHLSALLTWIMTESWHPEERESLPPKKRMIVPVRDYLDENYAAKITLDDLAARFFINKYYLAKMFKEQYGVNIHTYLLQIRITHAKQLLRFSEKGIEEIGLECGLGSAQYFSSKFKEIEGVAPSVYRKQW
ncbi:MAG: helix-turn-helix transcriptional regulator, partial [Lachnospiraceae bacterium]|nr:helix-turn-helix transcriptional regulator [Lachnospiraceae bacterium]